MGKTKKNAKTKINQIVVGKKNTLIFSPKKPENLTIKQQINTFVLKHVVSQVMVPFIAQSEDNIISHLAPTFSGSVTLLFGGIFSLQKINQTKDHKTIMLFGCFGYNQRNEGSML